MKIIREGSGGHNRLSKKEFIKKAQSIHKNVDGTPKYDYSEITDDGDFVYNIICPEHGSFDIKRALHIRKDGRGKCPKENIRKETKHTDDELRLAASKVSSKSEFETEYNSEYNATVKRGYDFYKEITSHFTKVSSIGEKKINDILEMMGVDFIPEKSFIDCKGDCNTLRFDFYLPDLKTCIEYDGDLHFKPSSRHYKNSTDKFLKRIRYDKLKNEYCIDNNIKLIRISHLTKKNDDIFNEIKKGLDSVEPIYLSKDYPKLGWNEQKMDYL
jgi:hypothetical protein